MITAIREVRRAKRMTLADVAAACVPPTTAQTIGRLETGTRTVSVGWLNRIAAALGVTAADLVTLPDRVDVPVAASLDPAGAHATPRSATTGPATNSGARWSRPPTSGPRSTAMSSCRGRRGASCSAGCSGATAASSICSRPVPGRGNRSSPTRRGWRARCNSSAASSSSADCPNPRGRLARSRCRDRLRNGVIHFAALHRQFLAL